MPATVLIGAQWGDEGKGRVADWLAANATVVARYAGGDNAGHTVYVGDSVFKLHLIPSGILHPKVVCVLGMGMVVNPVNLVNEIEELKLAGVTVDPVRLLLSTRAHLITPAHIALDRADEAQRGDSKIGTTLRGIGPAYSDKTARVGVRAGEMLDPAGFQRALREQIARVNSRLSAEGAEALDADAVIPRYLDAARYLQPYLRDTAAYLQDQLQRGATILCEGAQGTMLDIDHGDYPFVTSSSPTIGGALTGLGFGALHITRVVGVAKAFSTRVGSGPMLTELFDETAVRLRGGGENFWDEYGTTTGRPRRCGWFDGVMTRYATRINGFSEIVLTKLDILSGFDRLQIAIAYDLDGKRLTTPPLNPTDQARCKPIYRSFDGWSEPLGAIRAWDDLPSAARDYIDAISAVCGVPITTVSVGPERAQLVHRT